MTEQELIDLNLQVAAIAGWTDVQEWQPDPKNPRTRKTFQGVNLAHLELGQFVPNYVESIDAITALLERLKIYPVIDFTNDCVYYLGRDEFTFNFSEGFKVALSLCKLLLAINPEPINSESEVAVIDDDGEIDEPTVIEATFG